MEKPASSKLTDFNNTTGVLYKVLFWVSIVLLLYLSFGTSISIINGYYLDLTTSIFYFLFFFVFFILNLLKVFFNRSKFLYFAILSFFVFTCIFAVYNLVSFSFFNVVIPVFSSLYLAFFWASHKVIKPNLFIKLFVVLSSICFFILFAVGLYIGGQDNFYYNQQNKADTSDEDTSYSFLGDPDTLYASDIVLSFKDKYKDYLPEENVGAKLIWAVNDMHTIIVSDPLVFSYSFTSYDSSLLNYFKEDLKGINPNFVESALNSYDINDCEDIAYCNSDDVQKGFETDKIACSLMSYPYGYEPNKYTTNITCVDKKVLNNAYRDQKEYLNAFPKQSENYYIESIKRVGDYVNINWNPKPPYMAGGFLMIAKKEPGDDNNVWNILYKGQQRPTCSDIEKYSIPYNLINTCYDEEKEKYLCLNTLPKQNICFAEDATVGFSKPRVFIDPQNLDHSTTNVYLIENGKPKLLSSNVDFIVRIEGEPNYILLAKTTNVLDKSFPDGFYKSTDYELLNLKTKETKSLKGILKNDKKFIDFYLEIAQRPSFEQHDFSKKPEELIFKIMKKYGTPYNTGLWFFDYKTGTFEEYTKK